MDRFKETKIAGILGIFGNIFLLVIKASIGFISHSQAMIADSANSASDIFASLMTFIGNKIASEPSDKDHTLGHGKAEYIFSMFISISMILIAVKLLVDSFMSLINQETFQFSWWLVIVCIITILTKLSLYFYTSRLAKKHHNILLEANYKDHRNDCVVTTFTLISILLALKGIYWFDGIVGIGISIWICYTGVKILIESYNVLMDISINESTKDSILSLAHLYKDIQKLGTIYSTPIGYKYLIVTAIYVDGNLSTFASHELADQLEKDIIMNIDIIDKAIIHVNPI